jgi:pimeloyl-ACP methyl ester carboxylesterase
VSERDVLLRDGRTLHVYDDGAPDGFPFVVHHGTPGSGLPYAPYTALASAKGVRLLSYDRAGYGGSTPEPGRSVVDVAADIEDVLDALGIDRFASVGGSGGGPHSLALGVRLAGRCVATCAIACPAPWAAEGLDWLAGQGEMNQAEWAVALQGAEPLGRYLEQEATAMSGATSEQLLDVLATLLSPPDRAALTGELAEHLLVSTRRALEPGVAGWRDDDLAFVRPWGFEPAEVAVPVLLWQGEQDLMVPPDHARWLAPRLPDVEAHVDPAEGHLSIWERRLGEILDWLRARA